jgi:hypothetical protein
MDVTWARYPKLKGGEYGEFVLERVGVLWEFVPRS